jgi:PIN domain nuclease of toxin-antitoxin system
MPEIGLLIDAHALIWTVDDPSKLSPAANNAIAEPTNALFISAGTIWELAIKVGLSKLKLSLSYREWMDRAIADLGLVVLPITVPVADVQSQLPSHHGDPFDRLLISQAQLEQLSIVSSDSAFDQYGVSRIW